MVGTTAGLSDRERREPDGQGSGTGVRGWETGNLKTPQDCLSSCNEHEWILQFKMIRAKKYSVGLRLQKIKQMFLTNIFWKRVAI